MNQGTDLGSQKGRWVILAALVAVLGALLFLLPGVMAQESTTIEYTENSTDAVVTLSAGDPEGATPITWSLPAADPDGVLRPSGRCRRRRRRRLQDQPERRARIQESAQFREPDWRHWQRTSNTYSAVVQATDGDAGPPTAPEQPVGEGYPQLVQGDRQRLRRGGAGVDNVAPEYSGFHHVVTAPGWSADKQRRPDGWRRKWSSTRSRQLCNSNGHVPVVQDRQQVGDGDRHLRRDGG